MTRDDMICRGCDYYAVAKGRSECRRKSPEFTSYPATTPDSWCGEGRWREWDSDRKCSMPYFWGETNTDDFVKHAIGGTE